MACSPAAATSPQRSSTLLKFSSDSLPAIRSRVLLGLCTLFWVLRSMLDVRLHAAIKKFRHVTRIKERQRGATGKLLFNALSLCQRRLIGNVVGLWRQKVHPDRALTLDEQLSPAELLAQALVDMWKPFWAPRAGLLHRSMQTALQSQTADPMRRIRTAAAGSCALEIMSKKHRVHPCSKLQSASAQCLALALRRCVKRCLGATWRRLACGAARKGLAVALETLDACIETADQNVAALRRHGAIRLAAVLRRASTWRKGCAWAYLVTATETSPPFSAKPSHSAFKFGPSTMGSGTSCFVGARRAVMHSAEVQPITVSVLAP